MMSTPNTYKSAGVIPYDDHGFWLVQMKDRAKKTVVADFGGKREEEDNDEPWVTAAREMKEEGGLQFDQANCNTKECLQVDKGNHVVYFQHTTAPPTKTTDANVGSVQFFAWKDFASFPWQQLHPRLKFDQKNRLCNKFNGYSEQFGGTCYQQRVKRQKVHHPHVEDAAEQVVANYQVQEDDKPTVLTLREDVPDMRAAYWLNTLTLEEYTAKNPKRKEKLDKDDSRDYEAEFSKLKSFLESMLGRENVKRNYAYATGTTSGRIYVKDNGLQGLWSEIRGQLCRGGATDADMSNCHPRIFSWTCHENNIDDEEVEDFIQDRESIYMELVEALGCTRDEAKAIVLSMMNDQRPHWNPNLPPRAKALDAAFKRIQQLVCHLPQYAFLESKAKSDNKYGSWLNHILCYHERQLCAEGMKCLEGEGLEVMIDSFDGFMVYGNHYDREEELCGKLQAALKDKFGIDMPWTLKPHSTLLQVPDDFQVYDIPEEPFLANVKDRYLSSEEDFGRMMSGLRGTYEHSPCHTKGRYKAAAQSLMVRSKRPLADFDRYWNGDFQNLDVQILKHYSRLSNWDEHVATGMRKHKMFGTVEYSEVQLRDFFIDVWGDDLMAVGGDDGVRDLYVWWETQWMADNDGSKIRVKLIETIVALLKANWQWCYSKANQPEELNATSMSIEELPDVDDLEWGGVLGDIKKSWKRYNNSKIRNVQHLVVDWVRAYACKPVSPFDDLPYLFCFTNKIYDISQGRFVPPCKYYFCLMNCGYAWVEPTVTEMQTVAHIFASIFPDEELRLGYVSLLKSGMTGIRPESFPVATGGGRNGKGVLNELGAATAGEYYGEGHICILTKELRDGPNPEVAGLHKKRLVVFSEPEDGLVESIRLSNIKKLTGGGEINARNLHSNNTTTKLEATILMECNKTPIITGEKGEAAMERVRLYLFDQTFTSDPEKLQSDPEKYKPADKRYKEVGFKKQMRCAFFRYLMVHGGDAAWFPEQTKQMGAKYLEDHDDLAVWVKDNYEITNANPNAPIRDVVTIKEMWSVYEQSNFYKNLSKMEKKKITQTWLKEQVQSNLLLKKYYRAGSKASCLQSDGKYKTIVKDCVVHLRRTQDDGMDAYGEELFPIV